MKLRDTLTLVFAWGVIWLIVSLCWVGAEYVFEGAVHSSMVDGAVAAGLAAGTLRYVMAYQPKR